MLTLNLQISPDQNKLSIDTNKYEFVPTGTVSYKECAFKNTNDCKPVPCGPFSRKDKKEGCFKLINQ